MTIRPILITAVALMLTAPDAQAQTPPKPAPKPAPKTAPKTPPGGAATAAKKPAAAKPASKAALMNPSKLTAPAPPVFKATFETSKGDFVVEVHRYWAPKGADRFYNLVKNGFFDDCRFFRVVSGFMVQFGINGDPVIQKNWVQANIPDDPVKEKNQRGYITFANAGPNTRSTQVFINFADNSQLDAQGFAPFGQVVSGMDVVDKLYSTYGEAPSRQQGRIQVEGNKYLNATFPELDYVKRAVITK
jgi:peptidyl-prolyl cis-trans isomerase A (cyclophilin A)